MWLHEPTNMFPDVPQQVIDAVFYLAPVFFSLAFALIGDRILAACLVFGTLPILANLAPRFFAVGNLLAPYTVPFSVLLSYFGDWKGAAVHPTRLARWTSGFIGLSGAAYEIWVLIGVLRSGS